MYVKKHLYRAFGDFTWTHHTGYILIMNTCPKDVELNQNDVQALVEVNLLRDIIHGIQCYVGKLSGSIKKIEYVQHKTIFLSD